MLLTLLAAATITPGPTFSGPLLGKDLSAAEATVGGALTHIGKLKDGYDVYVYYRTPDHSVGSPYFFFLANQGKIGLVGWSSPSLVGPAWLGPSYAHPNNHPLDLQFFELFHNRPAAKPATVPAPDTRLVPQEAPDVPDQPVNDEGGDLPGNLVM